MLWTIISLPNIGPFWICKYIVIPRCSMGVLDKFISLLLVIIIEEKKRLVIRCKWGHGRACIIMACLIYSNICIMSITTKVRWTGSLKTVSSLFGCLYIYWNKSKGIAPKWTVVCVSWKSVFWEEATFWVSLRVACTSLTTQKNKNKKQWISRKMKEREDFEIFKRRIWMARNRYSFFTFSVLAFTAFVLGN